MHDAIYQAAEGVIVILGVTPDRPETGYGYIKTTVAPTATHAVERFVEQPYEAKAKQYLAEDGYYWNASKFVLKASVWLQAIASFRPDIADETLAAWPQRSSDAAVLRPGKAEFSAIPSGSTDYSVMERRPGSDFPIRMVPLDSVWSDLGAWDAVWSIQSGNAHVGDVPVTNCHNPLVHATSRLVGLVGVQNLMVVETPDAELLAHMSRTSSLSTSSAHFSSKSRKSTPCTARSTAPVAGTAALTKASASRSSAYRLSKASLSLQKHHHSCRALGCRQRYDRNDPWR